MLLQSIYLSPRRKVTSRASAVIGILSKGAVRRRVRNLADAGYIDLVLILKRGAQLIVDPGLGPGRRYTGGTVPSFRYVRPCSSTCANLLFAGVNPCALKLGCVRWNSLINQYDTEISTDS